MIEIRQIKNKIAQRRFVIDKELLVKRTYLQTSKDEFNKFSDIPRRIINLFFMSFIRKEVCLLLTNLIKSIRVCMQTHE